MVKLRVLAAVLVVNVLFAGGALAAAFGLVDTGELYVSTDGGLTWTIRATLPVHDAVGLAAGTSASDLYLVTRSGSMYRSTDAGSSWTPVAALAAFDVAALTINPDASVLLLTESGTVYRWTTARGGITALAALTGSNFVSLTRGPLGRLYALTRTGEIYESQDQGPTWTAVGAIATSAAASLRRKGAELYALTETGEVYRSLDYGRAWLAVGAITAIGMRGLVAQGSALLAAAETGEIYMSPNGTAWTPIGAINQLRVTALGEDTPLATGVPVEESVPPLAVRAPHPNPTSAGVGSRFTLVLAAPGEVRLAAYDARGRRVAAYGPIAVGRGGMHELTWRPAGLAAGSYFVRAETGSGATVSTRWTLIE